MASQKHDRSDPNSALPFSSEDISRLDETDDAIFYSTDRFVQHLDEVALHTVEQIIEKLIVEDEPVILDLMAGWDSHIPASINTSEVVGLGLNENELTENKALSSFVIHDLNKDPELPFPDGYFDAVINTVSVDYLTKPVEAFREVGRVLKPGGLFLVIFSNRFFPPKVVKIWRQSTEDERVILVEEFFKASGLFEQVKVYTSKGRPRPASDKYAHLDIPSDPIYAVYADKKGTNASRRPKSSLAMVHDKPIDPDEIKRRKNEIKNTLRCPYCDERLGKLKMPDTPFSEWDTEFMYLCINDACPYLVRGWEAMNRQGNRGMSYRLMYNPKRDRCMPAPVYDLNTLKDGIVD